MSGDSIFASRSIVSLFQNRISERRLCIATKSPRVLKVLYYKEIFSTRCGVLSFRYTVSLQRFYFERAAGETWGDINSYTGGGGFQYARAISFRYKVSPAYELSRHCFEDGETLYRNEITPAC